MTIVGAGAVTRKERAASAFACSVAGEQKSTMGDLGGKEEKERHRAQCMFSKAGAELAALAGWRCSSDTKKGWTGLIASEGAAERECASLAGRFARECVRECSLSPLSVPLGLNLLPSRQFPHGHHQAKPQWRSSQQKKKCAALK